MTAGSVGPYGVRKPRPHRAARLAHLPGDDELRQSTRAASGRSTRTTPSRSCAARRGRDHFLRHRRRLQRRPERGGHRPAAPQAVRHARGVRRRDEGARPDDARRERARPVAQAHPGLDRRLAGAARPRLRRPLPDPPLGSADADRGDDGGAARRRRGRQGPLHRREQHVRVAVRQGAARRGDARSCRCRTTTTSSTARRSGR